MPAWTSSSAVARQRVQAVRGGRLWPNQFPYEKLKMLAAIKANSSLWVREAQWTVRKSMKDSNSQRVT